MVSDGKKCIAVVGEGGHYRSSRQLLNQRDYQICNFFIELDFLPPNHIYTVMSKELAARHQPSSPVHYVNHRWIILIGDNFARQRVANSILGIDPDPLFPNLVSEKCQISESAKLGFGTVVMPFATLGEDSKVGNFCIINSSSIVEHDSVIGDFVHLAPGSIALGGSRIGQLSFLGSNSVVRDHVEFPSHSTLGALSFMHESAKFQGTYVGAPARRIQKT